MSSQVFKLIFVRHGESEWNKQNRFCGWFDADLSELGVNEAMAAGKMMKDAGLENFDVAFTSVLKRAIKTLYQIQDACDRHHVCVEKHWRLNERMYGALQGLDKAETAAKHGEDQVKIWRRSYDTPPPPLDETSEHFPGRDARYAHLDQKALPRSECLKDTVNRVMPFWCDTIVPTIRTGKNVLVVAHGNSIRAIVKYLDEMADSEIMELNIPTGIPLVYELDAATLKPIKHYYLADEKEVAEAIAKVKAQGQKK